MRDNIWQTESEILYCINRNKVNRTEVTSPVKINIKNEFWFLNLIVALLVLIIYIFPDNPLRIILGIPTAIFLPGYTFLAALLPKKTQINGIERAILSFVLSIAIVPLIALVLNFTSFHVKLEPVLYFTSGFIFVSSLVAWFRRRRLPAAIRFTIEFKFARPVWNRRTATGNIVLIFLVLGSLGLFTYFISHPQPADAYTEFYLLPVGNEDLNYLENLHTGQIAEVRIGIASHELTTSEYQIEVLLNNGSYEKFDSILLQPGGKSVQTVNFSFKNPGSRQKVEFVLYKAGLTYLKPLFLWVEVAP